MKIGPREQALRDMRAQQSPVPAKALRKIPGLIPGNVLTAVPATPRPQKRKTKRKAKAKR